MTASIPQTNPNASTVLSTVEYVPIASAIGAEFANVLPQLFRCIKVGQFIRIMGDVQVDVIAAALGDQICELSLPPILGIVDAQGFGISVNAGGLGAAAGSGVASLGFAPPKSMKLVMDDQPFVANGYVVRVDAVLFVLDADGT